MFFIYSFLNTLFTKYIISGSYSVAGQAAELELEYEDSKDEDYGSLCYSSEPSYGRSQLDFATPDSSVDADENNNEVDVERD